MMWALLIGQMGFQKWIDEGVKKFMMRIHIDMEILWDLNSQSLYFMVNASGFASCFVEY